jgi:molybdenum cofactor cytidylyltransferase
MTEIQGILPAAGAGERFGKHKLLYPLPDGDLVGVAAARCLIGVLPNSLAILRQGDNHLAEAYESLGLRVVENNQAGLGMGVSLAKGIEASADAHGWVIALADMPWIDAATILALVRRLEQGASLCAPVYQGRRGHPVGFGGQWRQQLMALRGDRGARDLLKAYPKELVLFPTDDRGVVLDIDNQADLNAQD